jgi:hypothetical protein
MMARKERLTDDQINTFGDIFPGFDTWYRANHDAEGQYIGEKLPGLTSPALLHLAEEVREQERDGETIEGGFAIEEGES